MVESAAVKTADVVIIGGGIAGLSVARGLARKGGRRIVLLEREEVFASHSSGRNAAIFRHLDGTPGGVELAIRSGRILDALVGSRPKWLKQTGALFVARSASGLEGLRAIAQRHEIPHRPLERDDLGRRAPHLRHGEAAFGLEVPGDGVMDIHAICTALADDARASGASLHLRSEVARLVVEGDRVDGVALTNSERIGAGMVVLAAGAWAAGLGESAGVPLPLHPLRRHLALLTEPDAGSPEAPIVWCVDDEAYFRPETGGVLASPCDEDPCEPCLPAEAAGARELLAEKLHRLAPSLAESGVRRSWACLRTFAPDRAMVVGCDPRVRGLFWAAGLGGHGMTAGVATGELVVSAIEGEHVPLLDALAPSRLLLCAA